MDVSQFFNELDERIRKYDLLCHPFYQAWSSGKLTNEDLREYAQDYYPHVQAFPTYLAEFGVRLPDGEMRRAVLANMSDEKGGEDVFGEPAGFCGGYGRSAFAPWQRSGSCHEAFDDVLPPRGC